MYETPVFLVLVALLISVVFYRRKKQLGKTWELPLASIIKVKGKELKCLHCGKRHFTKREGILVTTWMSFFRLVFFNESATCYVCLNCKFIHWFVKPNEEAKIIKYETPEE